MLKLQKAAQKINSILDLDQLIDKVVNDVARSFGCVEASIYLHDEVRANWLWLRPRVCRMRHVRQGPRLKVGKEGMVGYVAATGQMRYAPDVRKDPYYIGCEESTLSEVAIPLHVEGKLIGVFTLRTPSWMRSRPSNFGSCRRCAVTWQSRFTMHAASSRNGASASR